MGNGSWSNNATNLIVLIEQVSGYSGIFGYSPAPGPGNLIFSLAAVAGTDPYGNAYLAGIALYQGGVFTAVDNAGNMAILSPNTPTQGTLANLPGLSLQPSINTGDPAVVGALDDGAGDLSLLLTSPSPVQGGVPGSDFAQINMQGPYNGNPPFIAMNADAPGGTITLNSLTVDENAVISSYGFDSFNTYAPVVGGAGTATFSTRTGWWQRIGPMIFFTAYLVVNAPGSGAAAVTITAPTSVDRTTRQIIPMNAEGAFSAGLLSNGHAVAFTSGSGAVIDRIRTSNGGATNADGNLTGADLLANAIITIEGFYRQG